MLEVKTTSDDGSGSSWCSEPLLLTNTPCKAFIEFQNHLTSDDMISSDDILDEDET